MKLQVFINLACVFAEMDYEDKTKEELIRELQNLREVVEKSEERWRFALEGSGSGVWDWNVQTNEVFYSPYCKNMLGFADHEMENYLDAWHRRIHPNDLIRVMRELERHVKGESPIYEVEYRIRCKDGSYKWIAGRGKIMSKGEKGKPIRMVGVHLDITDRVRREEALRESENKFRDLAEKSDVGIFLLQERNFCYINQKFAEIHEYTIDEILYRKKPKDFIHPQDLPALKEKTLKTLSGEMDTFNHEFRIITGTGAVRTVDVYYSRTIYEGKPALIGTVLDVTQRRMLENQFLQSQKMEVIGLLAGGIAHDFNNILTSIIGNATLLNKDLPAGGRSDVHVNRIIESAERAAELTRSLLTLSRKQPLQLQKQRVSDIIRESEKLLKSLLVGGKIKFEVVFHEDVSVMADTTQIEVMLINLAKNAREAMPKGGQFQIEVRNSLIDDEFIRANGYGKIGHYAKIIVSDTGAGMDREKLSRIFQPFVQTQTGGMASGLGLTTVYAIVKQHKGYICAESEPGSGTTFHIYLPARETSPDKPAELVTEIHGGPETILLAEDYEEVRLLLKEVLESEGYRVLDAVDGEEAIRIFMNNKDIIQLAVLDIMMPKKNGREVFEAIRVEKPDMKVLFASGYTGEVALFDDIAQCGAEFLPKPLKPDTLLTKVRTMLDRSDNQT
ncbi:MAG: PAS domain-containing protein [Syntrophaceae bacterium]|nr:PAS domain-containing protein [Syntrophaceae bacterium]